MDPPAPSWSAKLENIARATDGMPAKTKTFSIWNPGALLIGLSMSTEPLGTCAIFSRAGFNSRPLRRKSSTASSCRIRSRLKAEATHSAVMSSWVGPMPPVVMTYVYLALHAFSVAMISALSSGRTRASSRRTPLRESSAPRNWRFLSWTKPTAC